MTMTPTPKEKAIELIDKFDLPTGLISSERVQCAIIAVKLRLEGCFMFSSIEYGEDSLEYWEQVKSELERM